MSSVMLATYPDVFAGGAIVAGLPYGAANNVQQAFENMFACPPRAARVWGDLVRRASPHKGPWPRVSVWHGGADAYVPPSNSIRMYEALAKAGVFVDLHIVAGVAHAFDFAPSQLETVQQASALFFRRGKGCRR